MNYDKAMRYTIAGFCGIVGFVITYVTIGWVLHPIQDWIENKFVRGTK